jgi:glucosamine 6-phosphate synthetase-like amidotransferase/phosphosugar isomerase protein
MCGIATISIGRSARKRIPYEKLRGLTSELLVELSSRGQDASGIAVINENSAHVFKKALRPKRLVVRPRFEDILQKIGPDTNFVMLHSRAASVGGNKNNFNNHPIVTDPIIGIHNGTLYNDHKLFTSFKDHFKPEGQVDSEVIFRMLNMYLDKGLAPKQAMQMVSQQLVGAFTGAAIDLRRTNQMLMFKYGRELAVLNLPHYDVVVAVSEAKFFDAARDKMKLKVKDTILYPKEETGFLIDINAGRITDQLIDFNLPVKEECRQSGKRWNNWVQFSGY